MLKKVCENLSAPKGRLSCQTFFCLFVGLQLRNLARKLLTSDHILVTCNGNKMNCDLRLQPKLAWHHLVAYNDNMATCNGNLENCKGNLVTCHGILVTCHLQWQLRTLKWQFRSLLSYFNTFSWYFGDLQ